MVQFHDAELEMPSPPGAPRRATVVATDGRFSEKGVFGPRVVRVEGLPPRWAVQAVLVDRQNMTDEPFDFRAANTPRNVRIVLTDATGTVQGVVRDSRGQPARARVVIFTRDERQWAATSRFLSSVRTAPDGRFAMSGLLPGEYAVAAVGALADDGWRDPGFLRRIGPQATSVSVGARATMELSLARRDRW
jgi:hypothetical protein